MTTDRQLYKCASCGRRAQQPSGTGGSCEFCGGALAPVWGLGQLAAACDDRDDTSAPALRRTAERS